MTPKLISERLLLRPVQQTDLEDVHILHSFAETDKFNTLGIPKNINETEQVLKGWLNEHRKYPISNYTFVIENKETDAFIGLIGLKLFSKKSCSAEVWYKIHPNQWKKGFATEALNHILDYGFDDLDLHRIQAGCAIDNIGSIRVLEKVGMIKEGRGRQILPLKNGWSDNFQYAILESNERK